MSVRTLLFLRMAAAAAAVKDEKKSKGEAIKLPNLIPE